ncbi:hypothetical protein [Dactylosporangium sp. NPDC051541]|uniref:hypothetical protein n=1 Tax=Dactylosporangium sp. NPDC051541 TaxID=3363977 RepID=UPI00378820DB
MKTEADARPEQSADGRVLREQWAQDLKVRIDQTRHNLEVAVAERVPHAGDAARVQAVRDFLAKADAAIAKRRRWGRSPLDHWRGLSVVAAFENVHAAEFFLVDLLPPAQICTLTPSVVARARATLDADDPQRKDAEQLDQERQRSRYVDPVRFKQALRAGFQAEDQIQMRIRSLRNLVVKCAILLFLLMAAMTTLVAFRPRAMPLCFTPKETVKVCPSGAGDAGRRESAEDVLIVAGLGLLGGAAAAAFSIRRVQAIPTPYDIPIALAFFKLPLGAFTAVTGLMLLGGEFVPGLSQLDTQRQILAYALGFGYAQQLMSRLLDEHAGKIVSRLPHTGPRTAALSPATDA